ncbi:hypothetical protein GOBAR_AA22137 [Gossypium barbadense]|uniref:Phosphatidic acid phosphatase type 2/haloperoxidase domain-containing protein n=1 Tax=Gossypium barbadense TaxID=3634 RepID=A0A2P5X5A3_GOSBA|nr:hypothetical protein GOBAR_AA22137 [Gossypium barbadense]
MESVVWQGLALSGIFSWIVITCYFDVTKKIRSLLQPWVSHHVVSGTSIILKIQKHQHKFLDALFSGLSCIVSVPFYTAFLPLLFWSGHGKLARQMTLLMALCDYLGNCIKDVVSAPRPNCPPVRRITATKDEEENALEYGLPSSHTLNTVCLSGFLVCYVLSYTQCEDAFVKLGAVTLACLLVGFIGFGRIYLGMHCLIDIIGGLVFGFMILAIWLTVHEYVDAFIVSGQNVTSFWAALSFLLLFAYPTPEFPTPSFEYHTAFDGVVFGIMKNRGMKKHEIGIRENLDAWLSFKRRKLTVSGADAVSSCFDNIADNVWALTMSKLALTEITSPSSKWYWIQFFYFSGSSAPYLVDETDQLLYCKALAKWILPVVSNTLGIPIKSTSYIPMLNGSATDKKSSEIKQSSYIHKMLFFSQQDLFDVDTGIRFLQYAGLAWSVVDLVPSLFCHLRL